MSTILFSNQTVEPETCGFIFRFKKRNEQKNVGFDVVFKNGAHH